MQDHEHYRLFLRLAETLNYTRTAADCHISPATLSRTVRRLEAATGGRLLERGPRGAALTEHGRRFRAYAAESLELWGRFRDGGVPEHGDGGRLGGTLRVFATVTACHSLLPDLLAPVRTAHPRVRIAMRTGDAASALALLEEGEADLAVAALPDRVPAALLSRPVAVTSLVLVRPGPAPAPDAPDRLTPPGADEPWVLPRQGLVRTAADQWFRRLGRTPRIEAEADGHEALLALVALGYGTGVVPRLVLRRSGLRHRLHEVPDGARRGPDPSGAAELPPALGDLTVGVCVRRADLHRPLVAAAWAATGEGGVEPR